MFLVAVRNISLGLEPGAVMNEFSIIRLYIYFKIECYEGLEVTWTYW